MGVKEFKPLGREAGRQKNCFAPNRKLPHYRKSKQSRALE
jgi:hypothetical protein